MNNKLYWCRICLSYSYSILNTFSHQVATLWIVCLLAVFLCTVKNAKNNIPYTAKFPIQWSAMRQMSSLKFKWTVWHKLRVASFKVIVTMRNASIRLWGQKQSAELNSYFVWDLITGTERFGIVRRWLKSKLFNWKCNILLHKFRGKWTKNWFEFFVAA